MADIGRSATIRHLLLCHRAMLPWFTLELEGRRCGGASSSRFSAALRWHGRSRRAQQPGKLPTIGFLGASTASNWSQWTAAFVQRLRELGWIEGRTVAIEYRWAEGRSERFTEIAAEFVRLKVDVILTVGSAVVAAKQVTSTIPIVFAMAVDPVGTWLGRESWRDRAATSPACRSSRPILPASGSNFCARCSPSLRRLAIIANVGYLRCRAGDRRGAGSGPQTWPRRRRAGNPAR